MDAAKRQGRRQQRPQQKIMMSNGQRQPAVWQSIEISLLLAEVFAETAFTSRIANIHCSRSIELSCMSSVRGQEGNLAFAGTSEPGPRMHIGCVNRGSDPQPSWPSALLPQAQMLPASVSRRLQDARHPSRIDSKGSPSRSSQAFGLCRAFELLPRSALLSQSRRDAPSGLYRAGGFVWKLEKLSL